MLRPFHKLSLSLPFPGGSHPFYCCLGDLGRPFPMGLPHQQNMSRTSTFLLTSYG